MKSTQGREGAMPQQNCLPLFFTKDISSDSKSISGMRVSIAKGHAGARN